MARDRDDTYVGQFSDADEKSPTSRQGCSYEEWLLKNQQKVASDQITASNTIGVDDDPNSLLNYHFDRGEAVGADDDFEENYESDSEYELDSYDSQAVTGPVTDSKVTNKVSNACQPQHYNSKVCLDKYQNHIYSNSATNKLGASDNSEKRSRKDKSDRETVQGVLDDRAWKVIHKLFNIEAISSIEGCISTGKEANVYFCPSIKYDDCALKIFETVNITFKDRDRYVTGDHKFRKGYSKHNNFKKVKLWAEKEMSNLHKLHVAGLPVPKPYLLRSHLLLMEFLGENGDPAPKLTDVDLSVNKARELYLELVRQMWIMYRKCKLVHGDLSQFNMLYYQNKAYIIDVSQAVTSEHPNAFNFLRRDCSAVTAFFHKKGVATMTVKELFMFIVDPAITEQNSEDCLEKLIEITSSRDGLSASQEVDEEVFKNAFLPKSIDQVIDFERDLALIKSGKGIPHDIHYQAIIGMKQDLSGAAATPQLLLDHQQECEEGSNLKQDSHDISVNDEANPSESEDELDVSADDHSDPKEAKTSVHRVREKGESLDEKKVRKKEVKEAQKEKRKQKIKKHVKKKATKK